MNTPSKNENQVIGLESLVRCLTPAPEDQVNLSELALDATVTANGKTVAERFQAAAEALAEAAMPIFEAAGMPVEEEPAEAQAGQVATKAPAAPLPPGPPVQRHVPVSPALDRSKH